MAKQETLISHKRRGPAPTGKGTPILTRLQPDLLEKLDAYVARQADEISRPEGIRRLVEMGLKSQRSKSV